jgi:hypothetical protein
MGDSGAGVFPFDLAECDAQSSIRNNNLASMHDEKNEPVKVYLVNPPSENPWRTRQDYLDDQRRATIQFWITIAVAILSLVSVVATAIVAIESLKRMTERHDSTSFAANASDPKLLAQAEKKLKDHIENLKSGKTETGILQWGAISNLNYKVSVRSSDGVILASLDYDQNSFLPGEQGDSPGTPFVKFTRSELELTYKESKWWLTGGRHRSFAPAGAENPTPDWAAYTPDNSKGLAMQLKMGYWFD